MTESAQSYRFDAPVVLLAAGFGTRMAPLTKATPKPLIPLAGRPLINYVVEAFASEGARHFAVNAHYLGEQIAAHLEALRGAHPSARFVLSDERNELLDTGGGAKKAMALMEGDPLFVANTDAFWPAGSDTPLARMRQRFDDRGEVVLLCAHPARSKGFRRSHDFCLAPEGRVTNDRGLPVIYAGVALLSRSAFEGTPDGPFSMYRILVEAREQGRLTGILLDAPWLHVGDPEAIAEAETVLKELTA